MGDNLHVVWTKFFQQRVETLWHRFTGHYRAMVVETNDPLIIGRVRVKCPDMHDWNLRRQDCPWAVPAHDLGGKRAGRWVNPYIGDWVWITCERNHPFGLVWTGFANPTRRKYYPYPSIFGRTPMAVTDDGRPADRPNDYQVDYLPKDGRPMSHGWQDRYGNLDMHSSVGYYPIEHAAAPPPPDFDAVQSATFQQVQQPPRINDPDLKYMVRHTKYGSCFILSDQGYWWSNSNGGGDGEFKGDANLDEPFEVNRWKYLLRLIGEDDFQGDHRRVGIWTRYGHKIEARDTGWAQHGPVDSTSRPGEYGDPTHLSKEETKDYRWIKLRTKGGMLRQMSDKGFHPQEDNFIRRLLLDEIEAKTEREDLWWANKDARWIRDITRYGLKFVLDDRGSDPRQADTMEAPRGNGALLKGRRTGGAKANRDRIGDPRGFYFEFNENDDANHTTWGSPLGLAIEMNDATEYVAVAAGLPRGYAMPWRGIQENEFLRRPVRAEDPETTTHHLILDLENEYVRLKTRAGQGPGPDDPSFNPADNALDIQQGFEARDGTNGDGPWVETVDGEHRGLWLSKGNRLGIWRAKQGVQMFILQDDDAKKLVIYNNEADGVVQIYCAGKVELMAGQSLALKSANDISFKAGGSIKMDASGTKLTIAPAGVQTNKSVSADRFNGRFPVCRPGSGAGTPAPGGADVDDPAQPVPPAKVEPADRGRAYNVPSIVADAEIEHPA
jgi:hypothetical protein